MSLRPATSPGQEAIEDRIDEQLSSLITQITNEITWYMRERSLTRADLAARMGVSPGRVSQVLSGGENLTLRTLASLATALNARFAVGLDPDESVPDGADVSFATVDLHDADVAEPIHVAEVSDDGLPPRDGHPAEANVSWVPSQH